MWESNKQLRKHQDELDQAGILTTIKRACKKNYNVIVNYEVVKNYRQRRSAKRYITRLHKTTFKTESE